MDKKDMVLADKTKYQRFNIFEIDDKIVCLLCMKDISCDEDPTSNLISKSKIITSHLLNESHEMKVKWLVTECFPDTMLEIQDENSSTFVDRLVLDFSLHLGNESSIVSQIGSNIICCVCSENVSGAIHNKYLMETVLFDHVKSDHHKTNLKKWLCWIYYFNKTPGFVMISRSGVYCFLCKTTIELTCNTSKTAFYIKDVLDHLKNQHALEITTHKDSITIQKGDEFKKDQDEGESAFAVAKNEKIYHEPADQPLGCIEPMEEIVQTYKNEDELKLNMVGHVNAIEDVYIGNELNDLNTDMEQLSLQTMLDPFQLNSLESEHDHCLPGSSKNSLTSNYSLGCGEVSMNNDYFTGDARGSDNSIDSSEVQNFIDFNNLGVLSEDELSAYSVSSDCEDYDNSSEVLTCPECGAFVEIVNENAEFSLQLHCQKHKDLESFNIENELAFNASVDYMCPICHDVIPIFNKNVELSVRHHFEERKIDHEGFGFAENSLVESDQFDNYLSALPEPLNKYKNFLLMEGNEIFCKLCNCTVSIKNDNGSVADVLSQHLTDSYHEDQYRSMSQDLALVVVDFNKKCQDSKPNLEIFETLMKKHPSIKSNKQFIEKKSIHYFCKLCQKYINHSPNESTLAFNFKFHLKSPKHRTKSKEVSSTLKEGCVEQNLKKDKDNMKQLKLKMENNLYRAQNQFCEVKLNHKYIVINEEKHSFLCDICNVSIDFSRSGNKLKSHCESPAHNNVLTKLVSKFVSKFCLPPDTNSNLKDLLNRMAGYDYLKPHTQFIVGGNQNCRCTVCDKAIPSASLNILEHLFGNNHNQQAYNALKKIGKEEGKRKRRRRRFKKKASNVNNKNQVP